MAIKEESNLLNSTINLRKRYALVDKLSAKPFNIFTILSVENDERYTHSAFISELLNPKGSHCQGDIFLKLFLSKIEWPDIEHTGLLNTKVKSEHHTGDGFIDIWINLGYANLGIENKIYAGDQPNQLHRYNEYSLTHKKPYKLIYLTLNGHDSEEAKTKDFEYLKWSYQEQIIPWLDLCIKETSRIPVLRETIYQYQQLLKKLCGMLQNENEAMELNDLLKKDFEHFEAANNIHEQFKSSKYDVKYSLWNEVANYFATKYSESLDIEIHFKEKEKNPKVYIGHKHLEEWYVCFCIEDMQGRPYYGIYSDSYNERTSAQKEMIDEYTELELYSEGYKASDYWFSWKYYDNIDFYTMDTLSKTFSTIDRETLIQQIVEPIDKLIARHGTRILEINKEIHNKLSK